MTWKVSRASQGFCFWWVASGKGLMVYGFSKSYNQSFRDCRNFIKRNQGWLYG